VVQQCVSVVWREDKVDLRFGNGIGNWALGLGELEWGIGKDIFGVRVRYPGDCRRL
jgi:hypothetical protein